MASAIMACADTRLLLHGVAQALPVRRVELRHPVEDVDEEPQSGVAADRGHQCVQLAWVASGVDGATIGETPQQGQVVLVGPLGSELAPELLEDDAGLEDLVELRVHPAQVQHDGVDDRPHGRLGDDEAATRAVPVRATCWCSTRRTASRNTARLT